MNYQRCEYCGEPAFRRYDTIALDGEKRKYFSCNERACRQKTIWLIQVDGFLNQTEAVSSEAFSL